MEQYLTWSHAGLWSCQWAGLTDGAAAGGVVAVAVLVVRVHVWAGVVTCAQADRFAMANVISAMVLVNAEFCWMSLFIAVYFCIATFARLLREAVMIFAC